MFKNGDKIKIPKTKSYGDSIEDSSIIKLAISKNQDYLYIASTNNSDNYLLVTNDIKEVNKPRELASGDFFLESDLELYEEDTYQLPEKWYVEGTSKYGLIREDHIREFFLKETKQKFGFMIGYYYYFNIASNSYTWTTDKQPLVEEGYIEITEEEFLKYVVNIKQENIIKDPHITTPKEWIELLINYTPKTKQIETHEKSISN